MANSQQPIANSATQTEAEMRYLVAHLQPGDKIEVDHEVKVGMTRWHTHTVGTVVRTDRLRHSLHYDRNFDDKVWSDIIVLQRDDGELTTITVDEFTRVRVLEPARGSASTPVDEAPNQMDASSVK
jgi:hypothetical protein